MRHLAHPEDVLQVEIPSGSFVQIRLSTELSLLTGALFRSMAAPDPKTGNVKATLYTEQIFTKTKACKYLLEALAARPEHATTQKTFA